MGIKVNACIFSAETGVKEIERGYYSTITLFARLRTWETKSSLRSGVPVRKFAGSNIPLSRGPSAGSQPPGRARGHAPGSPDPGGQVPWEKPGAMVWHLGLFRRLGAILIRTSAASWQRQTTTRRVRAGSLGSDRRGASPMRTPRRIMVSR